MYLMIIGGGSAAIHLLPQPTGLYTPTEAGFRTAANAEAALASAAS